MNLRKGFKITTWIISLIAFIGCAAWGTVLLLAGDTDYQELFSFAFISFGGIWAVYWIIHWLVEGFYKIGKKKVLKIIKWAVIIFFASVLFHLADYFVHKTTKVFEEDPKRMSGRFE